jgi:hypothetical protein
MPYVPVMPHRSISPRVLDDAAFPVRLKLRVPEEGLGAALIEALRWLRLEVGLDSFAHHDAESLDGETLAIHLRSLTDAAALLSAFPKLELADDTTSRTYTRRRIPRGQVAAVAPTSSAS